MTEIEEKLHSSLSKAYSNNSCKSFPGTYKQIVSLSSKKQSSSTQGLVCIFRVSTAFALISLIFTAVKGKLSTHVSGKAIKRTAECVLRFPLPRVLSGKVILRRVCEKLFKLG